MREGEAEIGVPWRKSATGAFGLEGGGTINVSKIYGHDGKAKGAVLPNFLGNTNRIGGNARPFQRAGMAKHHLSLLYPAKASYIESIMDSTPVTMEVDMV